MATTTIRLGLRKPDPDPLTGDYVNAGDDLNDNWDNLDGKLPFVVCTSSTRPGSPYDGMSIYETDTDCVRFWDGVAWMRLLAEGQNLAWPESIGIERASATSASFRSFATGDGFERYLQLASGKQSWGPGTATQDVHFERSGTGVLTLTGGLTITGALNVSGLIVPGSGYMFKERVFISSSTSFTKGSYTGIRAVMVWCQSGGNAGGGAAATAASQSSAGGGGAGGGAAISFLLASALASSETVTIGAGGAGVSGATGNQGGLTSFGSLVIADNGDSTSVGGVTGAAGTAAGADGGQPTFAGTGQLLIAGGGGGPGWRGGTVGCMGGSGGSSLFGGGGGGPGAASTANAGRAGILYGGGGSGAANGPSQTARSGGSGAAGCVVVDVYV